MRIEEKADLIEQFANDSNGFDDTLNLSGEMLSFRPSKGSWSIIEIIMHCADVDTANYHRYRWGIAKPGTIVPSIDGSWARKLNYQESEISVAINMIKAVRHFMANHLKQIINDDWTKYVYAFPNGKSLNLEEALPQYINHTIEHKESIDKNIRLFNENEYQE